MNTSHSARAKRLTAHLNATTGVKITHCQALHAIAAEEGFADWQTLKASIDDGVKKEAASPKPTCIAVYRGKRANPIALLLPTKVDKNDMPNMAKNVAQAIGIGDTTPDDWEIIENIQPLNADVTSANTPALQTNSDVTTSSSAEQPLLLPTTLPEFMTRIKIHLQTAHSPLERLVVHLSYPGVLSPEDIGKVENDAGDLIEIPDVSDPLTLGSIAELVGLQRERIRHIKSVTLKSIKDHIGPDLLQALKAA